MAVDDEFEIANGNPSLFCTVQDDDFVGRFRELSFAYDELWLDDWHRAPEVLAAASRGD